MPSTSGLFSASEYRTACDEDICACVHTLANVSLVNPTIHSHVKHWKFGPDAAHFVKNAGIKCSTSVPWRYLFESRT